MFVKYFQNTPAGHHIRKRQPSIAPVANRTAVRFLLSPLRTFRETLSPLPSCTLSVHRAHRTSYFFVLTSSFLLAIYRAPRARFPVQINTPSILLSFHRGLRPCSLHVPRPLYLTPPPQTCHSQLVTSLSQKELSELSALFVHRLFCHPFCSFCFPKRCALRAGSG